ncbi:MAG: hypothetical protein AAFV80_23715 [Bacteroidota bacterium]
MKPKELSLWVKDEDNGLRKTKVIEDIVFDVQYKPKDFQVANYYKKAELSKTEYEAVHEKYEDLHFFDLKISVNDPLQKDITRYQVANNEEWQERLYYLSFPMQHDIKLVEGRDTIPCALYHFERSYDVADHRTFVLAFAKQENQSDHLPKTLIIDSPVFRTGPVKLKFSESALKNLPGLKLAS